MKRFSFRLEKLLRLRSQQTEQAKRALAAAMAAEEQSRQQMQQLHTQLNARLVEIRQKERAGLVAFDFATLRTHVRFLQGRFDQALEHLKAAEEFTAQKRLELIEARRRERALERLRERKLEVYTQELLKEEQKELDEFGDRQGLNDGVSPYEI